jgi:2-polyprenyl-3-methyl-5-hydroxy-6-metoxy-1,4-benzoquinol methylase
VRAIRGVLRDLLEERISAPVAAARLLFHRETPARLLELVRAHRVAGAVAGRDGRRLDDLETLLREHADGAARVQDLIVRHEKLLGTRRRGEAIEAWGRFFDEAVGRCEPGSLAAFSLGSAEILERGTRELAAFLVDGGLAGARSRVLEIGCGTGRFASALAPLVARYHGTDIALAMLAIARRRVTAPNVSFSLSPGRDLAELRDRCFDLVLAVDSFPYVHDAGPELVEAHVAGAARVLSPRGRLVVFNYSYLGDPLSEKVEVAGLAAAHGFLLEAAGVKPFRLWDGVLYQMKKR